jgi:hypothetical protein
MSTVFQADPPPRIEILTAKGDSFVLQNAVSCTTSRALSNPVAQASVMFMDDRIVGTGSKFDGKRFSDAIGLYDMVRISWPARDGRPWQDGIYLTQRPLQLHLKPAQGPTDQFTLSLLSVGEALQRYKIFWSPWLENRNNFAGLGFLARSAGKIVRGRPNQVILALLEIFLNDDYAFRFADGKKLKESFLPLLQDIAESLNVVGLSALNAEGALWGTLKRYADQPWNEFFVDVPHENALGRPADRTQAQQLELAGALRPYGQQEAIYLRPTPFEADRWANLRAEDGWGFDYDGSDAMDGGEQMGLDADSIANYFWAAPKVIYSQFDMIQLIRQQTGGRVPIAFEDSIRKFGLRKMECGTEYVQLSGENILDDATRQEGKISVRTEADLILRRTEQLARWFGYPDFWSGQITTLGRVGANRKTGARIGGILRNAQDRREYYIESIAQSWSQGTPWTTTLNLSRGHIPAEHAAWRKERGL